MTISANVWQLILICYLKKLIVSYIDFIAWDGLLRGNSQHSGGIFKHLFLKLARLVGPRQPKQLAPFVG